MGTLKSIVVHEYGIIIIFLVLVLLIVGCLAFLSLLFAISSPNPEKLSAYECGFNPFGDARLPFSIQFYSLAVLFILLDAEIALLFPLVLVYFYLSTFAFFFAFMFIFLLGITIGYEWSVGAFESV